MEEIEELKNRISILESEKNELDSKFEAIKNERDNAIRERDEANDTIKSLSVKEPEKEITFADILRKE